MNPHDSSKPDARLSRAMKWLNECATHSDPTTLWHLANLFEHGAALLLPDHAKAMEYWIRLANSGSADAMFHVSKMYSQGHAPHGQQGSSQQELDELALAFCRKAAALSHRLAIFRMGMWCETGFSSQSVSFPKALAWYAKLEKECYNEDELTDKARSRSLHLKAQSGDMNAAYEFGLKCHYQGASPKAEHWLTLAANNGHIEAQYQVACLLLKRSSISESETEAWQREENAKSWLLTAANLGHQKAKQEVVELDWARYQRMRKNPDGDALAITNFRHQLYKLLEPELALSDWAWKIYLLLLCDEEEFIQKIPTFVELCKEHYITAEISSALLTKARQSEENNLDWLYYLFVLLSQIPKYWGTQTRLLHSGLINLLLELDPTKLSIELQKTYILYAANKVPRQDPQIAWNLGRLWDIAHNDAKACYWYQRAANRAHADAQCALGDCYIQGRGVDVNVGMGLSWYRQAAIQGNVMALHRLESAATGGNRYASRFLERRRSSPHSPSVDDEPRTS